MPEKQQQDIDEILKDIRESGQIFYIVLFFR